MIAQKKQFLDNEVQQICNMCMALGIHKSVYVGQSKMLSHMPVSLYPYQISQEIYNKLRKAHFIWVKLLLKVSKDIKFVNQVFEKIAKSDDFVKRYLQLYNKYIDQQKFGVTCIRVDYMGDENPQLVEFNLMSVGLNGISDRVQNLASLKQLHRQKSNEVFYPTNTNQIQLLNAIQVVLKEEKLQGIFLMVVHQQHQKQFNFGDQNSFELQALKRKIPVKRVSMTQLLDQSKLNENNDFYFGQQKVSLVYFRTAYSPIHYTTQQHWKIRQQVQRANLISIPSISMQLINFKRMQVQLSKLQILKNYLPEQQAHLLKSVTGEIYDFEKEQQIQNLEKLSHSNNYVLKSNRQGGGNNYFGAEAAQKIDQYIKMPGQLQKYVLMKKIKSQIRDNVFISNYRYLQVKQSTCEYSTFGSFAYKKYELIFNEYGGNLIRLKRAEQNEGGIAIDKAVIAGLCVKKSKID